jgi:hypothetical protein
MNNSKKDNIMKKLLVTTILSVASLSVSSWAMPPGLMLTATDLSKVPDDSLCQNGGPSRDCYYLLHQQTPGNTMAHMISYSN